MRRLVLWAVPAMLLACAVALRSDLGDGGPRSPEPPRPTVNHKLHTERDVLCADCHDPKETGTPTIPDSKTCFECHEKDLSQEPERVQAYFETAKQPDGSYRFSRPAYMADLIMPHKEHIESGVECVSCHGPPLERAFPRPAPLALMTKCIDCHEQKPERPTTCETCHKETRKDVKPASHAAPGFRTVHGKSAPKGWRTGQGESCAICHEVPQGCNLCHSETKPETHRAAGWNRFHGRGDLLGNERPFADLSCSLCHEQRACSACHQTHKPKSHTRAWERQYHGIQVDLNRQSCTTCHKQDFCSSCHQSTEPVSHRGNWDQAHCLYCHEPLQSNGCFACHKNTLDHLTAPPKPGNVTHTGASDPTDCQNCHVVLPHFDSGGRCGMCHR